MVGLPARGKSYLTNKLTRYLNWLQHDTRVFNVGNTRRKAQPELGPFTHPLTDQHTRLESVEEEETPHSASFFSPDNAASFALREKWAMDTLDQLLDYLVDGPGCVGIFDATNTTKNRRAKLLRKIQERSQGQLKVLFLESVCTDAKIIETNMRLKLSGPDYRGMDPETALEDFRGRLTNYERAYEAIDDEEEQRNLEFMYVKMIDVGRKIVAYNISGFLASQTIYYLLNFNLAERQIWVTRHGESEDNVSGRIGGDAPLTARGRLFAQALTRFMDFQRGEFRKQQLDEFRKRLLLRFPTAEPPEPAEFYVWSSMLQRSAETTQYFDEEAYTLKEMRILNELGAGVCEGMTYKEIQSEYPAEFEARIKDKLAYRYPGVGGESYLDVINRVKPLINEIERTKNHVLIVTHRVVARVLLAYFLNLHKSIIGLLDVPLHSLYCLECKPYGTDYYYYEYDEKRDWFFKVDPEHQKKTKQVGVTFQERRYSVVPTAPSSVGTFA
ncbi:hypothetical protein BABINDRAFT_170204 [Babjeviella inositovora NRRL Y-12698]|uniref:6-phosphofructo-2-kinase domain-containing protein n=1 Tax=Babjeviella inositovora NRRL Y-12698 TaxID=984486 RepID=A0A1E3QZZ7_9ASCO|nr:uncharacterized protein BABINDRAFT_170204 [Babjeviella inositovora NRRL Y-12698]ODQ83226.1 hypothetical protein BABINDRAFT_170204 [Babjeviella inositovora NRRL Y-12698]